MGVPTFYRWLCSRYPLIVKEMKDAVDENTCFDDLDLTEPNINGEFDCLYLDMNGIIHPCCNPSGGDKPKDESEMFTRVCDYIDRLYAMVKPRRLVYMAIDGVAPRAKMNQQRSRRYKTALDMDYNRRAYEIAQDEFQKMGYKCPEYVEKWDSNVITPGTPFMERLTMCLHAYIRRKFDTDESWRSISVIFSDSNVPGEGEHKILEFIRSQRSNAEYNPNTRHVLYGSDADLIMLGLSTHETNFYIVREAVRDFKIEAPSSISVVYNAYVEKMNGLGLSGCRHEESGMQGGAFGVASAKGPNTGKKLRIYSWWSDIEIVDLSMLREYLNFDFNEIREQIRYLQGTGEDVKAGGCDIVRVGCKGMLKYDFERCVDDFVFLCFFIGNDFLPNLPVFSIYKGSLDQIIGIYIRVLPRIGDYLTFEGNIIPGSIIQFFGYLRDLEYEIIVQESRFNQRGGRTGGRGAQNAMAGEQQEQEGSGPGQNQGSSSTTPLEASSGSHGARSGRPTVSVSEIELLFSGENTDSGLAGSEALKKQTESRQGSCHPNRNTESKRRFDSIDSYFQEHLARLVRYLSEVEDLEESNSSSSAAANGAGAGRALVSLDNPESLLRYRLNYYNSKFKTDINLEGSEERVEEARARLNEVSDQVCIHYLRGLSWVLRYYYHGVPSWDWYYPYHYAPYVIDIVEMLSNVGNEIKVKESLVGEFELGKPFTQFEQLMSVLPPKSGRICLPGEFYDMMVDGSSSLSEFYPSKFKQDPNGNKQRWKWVALLPFIDQKVLLEAVTPLEERMDVLSKYRNRLGCDILYAFKFSPVKTVLEKCRSSALSGGGDQFTIRICDMPIFGYLRSYYCPDLKIQDCDLEKQVTAPVVEACTDLQQSREIIEKMLSDDRSRLQWKSILESSFNVQTDHQSQSYLIGYFKTEGLERELIWKDEANQGLQMFRVGFGSKTLPNSRPFHNSVSQSDLDNQERKFKGFKANQSQKILFKLFNLWCLNVDFNQRSEYGDSSLNLARRFGEQPNSTYHHSHSSQFYHQGLVLQEESYNTSRHHHYHRYSPQQPSKRATPYGHESSGRLYNDYYSQNRDRILDDYYYRDSTRNPSHHYTNSYHPSNPAPSHSSFEHGNSIRYGMRVSSHRPRADRSRGNFRPDQHYNNNHPQTYHPYSHHPQPPQPRDSNKRNRQ